MAEQDFNINIRTTANTAGVDQIKAALTGLGAQVNSINAASGGSGGGGGGDVLDKAAAKIEHGIFRTAVHAIGIGVVFEMVSALKEAAAEIEKTSEALNKQGEMLLKNAELATHQARFVKDENEELKISEKALKDIETARKGLAEITEKDLSTFSSFSQAWQNFSDFINVQMFKNRGKTMGDYEAARLENAKTAMNQLSQAQKAGMDEVLKTEAARNAGYEEQKKQLENLITEEEKHKATAKAAGDAEDYTKAANALHIMRIEMDALNAAHDKLVSKTEKYVGGADPQVKAILMNEKAMFEARAAGRDQDASMYECTAQLYRQSATPKQLEDVNKIYGAPALIDALKNNTEAVRNNTELWR